MTTPAKWESELRSFYRASVKMPGSNLAFEDYLLPKVKDIIDDTLSDYKSRLLSEVEGMIKNEGQEEHKTDIGANWAFLKVIALIRKEN